MAQPKDEAATAVAATAAAAPTMSEQFANRPLAEHGSRWNACWERGETGWDRGGHSAALLEVLTRGVLNPDDDGDGGGADGHWTAERLFPGHPATTTTTTTTRRRRMRALVPGCGRGYDVLLLSSLGYDVVGVDLSPVGVERARQHADERARDGSYPPKLELGSPGRREQQREPGTFRFVEGDFFKDDWLEQVARESDGDDGGGDGPDAKFDLIFDYTHPHPHPSVYPQLSRTTLASHTSPSPDTPADTTNVQFGCALPPQARPLWAARLASLLSPPPPARQPSADTASTSTAEGRGRGGGGGRLVCLEFPSTKSPEEPGPPWAMPPHVYVEYLTGAGAGAGGEEEGQGEGSSELPKHGSGSGGSGGSGLRRLVHGKPTTTHAAGMQDGRVIDCISVWSHS